MVLRERRAWGFSDLLTSIRRCLATILPTLALLSVGSQLSASEWEFIILAEEGVTPVPGMATTFLSLDTPSHSAERVVFPGTHLSSFEGVWEWRAGQLSTVISSADLTFRGLPDISGSVRSFTANGVAYTRDGGGPLVAVADVLTPVPEGLGNFQNFRWVATDGTSVVFTANGALNGLPLGVYSGPVGGGPLVKIADTGDGFRFFYKPVYTSSGRLVFTAYDMQGDTGVYRANTNGSDLRVVADGKTPVPYPGVSETFIEYTLGYLPPSISGDTVIFYGIGGGRRGIFRKRGANVLEPVVTDLNSPPGTGDKFADFYALSLSGENVAFVASGFVGSEIPRGLFMILDGQIEKVIDYSQKINGRPFANLHLSPEGLDGTSIAFYVFFDDTNTDAVVLARCIDCRQIFKDGFESGTTSQWLATVP